MYLVLASEFDPLAAALVERWPGGDARLLRPVDFTRAGVAIPFGRESEATLRVGDEHVRADAISGVVTRLRAVHPDELYRVAPADRPYVAAELNALFSYFFSALPCPVVNRPGPDGLVGPMLGLEAWTLAAARAGLTVQPFVAVTPAARIPIIGGERTSVVIVGARSFGAAPEGIHGGCRALAQALRVSLLEVHFGLEGGVYTFAGADLTPDLTPPPRLEALLAALGGRA